MREFVQDRTIWLKWIGLMWLVGGLIGLVWGVVALIASPGVHLLLARLLPAGQAFSGALSISPWAEATGLLPDV